MAPEILDLVSDPEDFVPLPPSTQPAANSEGIKMINVKAGLTHWCVDEFTSLPKKPGATSKLQEYTLEGIKVLFPFQAYPSQLDMMTSVAR
jgi:hypothetical protein